MYEEILTTAKRAAGRAAGIHQKYLKEGFTSDSKEVHHNTVTSADLDSEKVIVETIRESFPDHNILAEEEAYPATGSPYTWIIDPLDGTNNFLKGYPHYAVSIGVRYEEEVVVGVVRNSARSELFYAVKGGGAYVNDVPMRASTQEGFTNALLFTGFHYDRGEQMRRTLGAIEYFFGQGAIGIRRAGSAALDQCYIAAGWGDGFWEHILSPWDIGAGILIAAEAGARMTDFHGNPPSLDTPGPVIAANPRLHPLLLEELQKLYNVT